MDLDDDKTLEDLFNQANENEDGKEDNQKSFSKEEEGKEVENKDNNQNVSNEDELDKEKDVFTIEEGENNDIVDDDIEEDPALILQKYKTLQGMFKKQKEQLTKLETDLKKYNSTPDTPDDTIEPPNQHIEDTKKDEDITSWISDTLSSNDSIKSFSEDFPEVKEFVETALKDIFKKYQMAEQVAFKTLYDQIEDKINPLSKTFTEQQKVMQIAQVQKEHPDFDTIIDNPDFSAWIGSQPERLRDTYNTILEEGTAEEVIYLLNEYKSKNNLLKPKVVPKSKNTAVSPKSPISKDDFEAAFNEALKE